MASAVEVITNEAAKDLFRYFCKRHIRLDKAVKFGHNRWKYIDVIMLKGEGEEVSVWWKKLERNPQYKSLLRRIIWEKFLSILTSKVTQIIESNRE